MKSENRIPLALLFLRLSVFLVMLVWTLDKFVDSEHAARVYEKYYFIGWAGGLPIKVFGALELVIIIGFLLGYRKRLTYGLVFIFHAVSTLSTFESYIAFEKLTFFTAWPMLAACFALYYLRDLDTKLVIGSPGNTAR